jgi:hypothetical protein
MEDAIKFHNHSRFGLRYVSNPHLPPTVLGRSTKIQTWQRYCWE